MTQHSVPSPSIHPAPSWCSGSTKETPGVTSVCLCRRMLSPGWGDHGPCVSTASSVKMSLERTSPVHPLPSMSVAAVLPAGHVHLVLVACCVCVYRQGVCLHVPGGVFVSVGAVSTGRELLCMAGQVSAQVRASCGCTAPRCAHTWTRAGPVCVSREQLCLSLGWGCSLGGAPVPPPRAGTQA